MHVQLSIVTKRYSFHHWWDHDDRPMKVRSSITNIDKDQLNYGIIKTLLLSIMNERKNFRTEGTRETKRADFRRTKFSELGFETNIEQ